MGVPTGPSERDGELPDGVDRPSDQQDPGRGAAQTEHAVGRVRQETHICKLPDEQNLVCGKQQIIYIHDGYRYQLFFCF